MEASQEININAFNAFDEKWTIVGADAIRYYNFGTYTVGTGLCAILHAS